MAHESKGATMSGTKSPSTLLVANEVPSRAALEELTGSSDVLVVAPALNSRLRHWLSDEDGARRRAEDRLARSLERLAGEGVDAKGWGRRPRSRPGDRRRL